MNEIRQTKSSTFKFKSNPFNFSLRNKLSKSNLKVNNNNSSAIIPQPSNVSFQYDSSGPVSEASYGSDSDQPLPAWRKLNSQSPASELPNTWAEWNLAYKEGKIDFSDPPPSPDTLEDSPFEYPNKSYLAPRPDNERLRQKALDATGILERKNSIPDNPMIPISRKRESNPVLDEICLRASKTFGGNFAGVNMIDGEYVVFSANVGFEGVEGNPRDATVCAHTLLAASTNGSESTVILDLKKDWRFKSSPNHEGFYASFPIMADASFGDKSAISYPIGLMCVMDSVPRKSFSSKERKSLEIFAREAGAEISRVTKRRRSLVEDERMEKHDEWSQASLAYSIETLASGGESSRNNSVTSIPPAYSAYSPDPLISNVSQCPVFPRRRAIRPGVSAPVSQSVPPNLKKVFDLATSLLAETLGFDYVYFLSVDLNPLTPVSQTLDMISSHNAPIPPPLFDFQMHLDPLHSSSTLLYNNPDENDSVEGHFATGLLLKVGVASSQDGFVLGSGFILAGFSEDRTKVLNHMDHIFFSNFASDLSKHIGKL